METGGGSVTGPLTGFAIGAIVGAGIALLFAPDSGKRTRQRLGDSAQKFGRVASEKLDAAKGVVQEFGSDAKAAFKAGQDTFAEGREKRSQSQSRLGGQQYQSEETTH